MHPVLFRIGDFTIGTYGLLIVLGMLAGLWLAARMARPRSLPPEFFFDLTFVLLVSGFVGARLAFIIIEWETFIANPLALLLSRQGFVFLGGFALALPVGIWFTRRRGLPLVEVMDVMAPSLALGHAIGRIGCFLAGCCYGKSCEIGPDGPHGVLEHLAVQYPLVTEPDGRISRMFNFAYQDQLEHGLIEPGAQAPLPIVPVQLFEFGGLLLICGALLLLWRRRGFSGQIFAAYMALYALLRFNLEFLRGDTARGMWFGATLSTSQLLSIGVLAGAVALYLWRRRLGIIDYQPPAAREAMSSEDDPDRGEAPPHDSAAHVPADAPPGRSRRRRRNN